LAQKTPEFLKFVVCPQGQKNGVKTVRTFCRQGGGGGQFFAIWCGRPLWTDPFANCNQVKIESIQKYNYLKSTRY